MKKLFQALAKSSSLASMVPKISPAGVSRKTVTANTNVRATDIVAKIVGTTLNLKGMAASNERTMRVPINALR